MAIIDLLKEFVLQIVLSIIAIVIMIFLYRLIIIAMRKSTFKLSKSKRSRILVKKTLRMLTIMLVSIEIAIIWGVNSHLPPVY